MRSAYLVLASAGLLIGVMLPSAAADELNHLEAEARAMKAEAAELREKGSLDEAQHLDKAAAALISKFKQSSEKPGNHGVQNENPDVQHLQDRLRELRGAIESAEAKGESEQVRNELREHLEQTEHKLAEIKNRGHRAEIPPQFREDFERLEHVAHRVQLVRKAAENLKSAELHDLAHEVMKKAEAMEQEIQAGKRELSKAMQAFHKDREPESGGDVQKLRSENELLRKELNELREAVELLRKEGKVQSESKIKKRFFDDIEN